MTLDTLLLELDHQARTAATALEATGKLAPRFVDDHYPLTRREELELRRLKTAAAIAVDVDAYVELARGRRVTASRIKPRALEHHRQELLRGR